MSFLPRTLARIRELSEDMNKTTLAVVVGCVVVSVIWILA